MRSAGKTRRKVLSAPRQRLSDCLAPQNPAIRIAQAGTLLIKVDYNQAVSEMEDKLETLELRKQTMARQEERVMKKLEEMQSSIQSAMQGLNPDA